MRPESEKQFISPVSIADVVHSRCNTGLVAIGNLKRVHIGPFGTWYISPDIYAWIFPTLITLGLTFGTLYLVGDQRGATEKGVLGLLLLVAFSASLLVGSTDPGVYPRLNPGERDPFELVAGMQLCKICNVRRPPRSAHCYTCGVCVLEHDHHCGVLGGCVGQRSLRWFTLYLLSVSSAAAVGACWVGMSLLYPPIGENSRPTAHEVMSQRGRRANSASLATAGHIFLLIFIGNVVLLVGGMGIYYLYLMLSDTTRREAQGKLPRNSREGPNILMSAAAAVSRVWCSVPQSLLESRDVLCSRSPAELVV